MRLLHVVATGTRRGAEIFAMDLVRALGRSGMQQRVAVLRSRGEMSLQFDAPVQVLDGSGRSLPGLRVNAGALRQLRGIVRAWRPDLVQAHGGEPFKNVAVATAGQGVPLIYRRIGAAPPSLSTVPMRVTYSALMRRASRVVAVADAISAEAVRMFGVPASRVVTIPNGVDVSRMQPERSRHDTRLALGIPSDAPVSLTLGALVWEKDPLAHLEVVSRVFREVPTAVHMFVGDGPFRPQVESVIRQRGLQDRVIVLGTRPDVADLLAAADVLLFASRTEGMPASVIEAGIAGLPTVAYAVAGVPEVVRDGITGILVAPGDVKGLANEVIDLFADAPARQRLAREARDHCLERFDINVIAPRYRQLYEQVAAERS